MANELQITTRNAAGDGWVDVLPGAAATGYQAQNANIVAIMKGWDETTLKIADPSGAGNYVVQIQEGGLVEDGGLPFSIRQNYAIGEAPVGQSYVVVLPGSSPTERTLALNQQHSKPRWSAEDNCYLAMIDGVERRVLNHLITRYGTGPEVSIQRMSLGGELYGGVGINPASRGLGANSYAMGMDLYPPWGSWGKFFTVRPTQLATGHSNLVRGYTGWGRGMITITYDGILTFFRGVGGPVYTTHTLPGYSADAESVVSMGYWDDDPAGRSIVVISRNGAAGFYKKYLASDYSLVDSGSLGSSPDFFSYVHIKKDGQMLASPNIGQAKLYADYTGANVVQTFASGGGPVMYDEARYEYIFLNHSGTIDYVADVNVYFSHDKFISEFILDGSVASQPAVGAADVRGAWLSKEGQLFAVSVGNSNTLWASQSGIPSNVLF